jgi:hypothetical protein
MVLLGLLVFAALMIPIVVVLVDSPIGKALARRLEGPDPAGPVIAELSRKMELLETELDELSRSVDRLREENQFLQKLIEDKPTRPSLPPPGPPS